MEVTALAEQELYAAIVEPAKSVGVTVEPALVERLVADAAGEPGILPFLQETMVLLWAYEMRRQVALAAYAQLAAGQGGTGLQAAIARRAEQALSDLSEPGRALVRRLFLRLVHFGQGRPDTRRQLPLSQLWTEQDDPDLTEKVVGHLTTQRLLVLSGEEGEEPKIDIAHEALLRGWPRLRQWIERPHEAEQTRRHLEGKAEEWVRLGQGEGGLLDKYELPEAERWCGSADAADLGVSRALAALVSTSRDRLSAVAQAQEAARQRELDLERRRAEADATRRTTDCLCQATALPESVAGWIAGPCAHRRRLGGLGLLAG